MERKFDYNQKETYTQEEMDAILGQHSSFIDVDKVKAELVTAQGELKPFKQAARNKHVAGLVSDLTDATKLTAAIKLAEITVEDDDASIKTKVAQAIKDNAFLAKSSIDDPAGGNKEKKELQSKVKEQTVAEFQKEQRLRNI